MYFYNLDTGKLHMEGCCPHSKTHPNHIKFFKTEKEAFAFGGQKINWCDICQKKREEKLKEV